jgi:ABC-type polysaccharide/polyol phosphate transport system ATPase subunit
MSSELLLRARGLCKTYSGTKHPFATLVHALFNFQEDESDEYAALNDIDIEIFRGETVGIMGRNGAGKTTLLGILGNVIEPTAGGVERYGRIATLLGLTAGFNPNFSGRENAYLFCSIQGLTRKQTDGRIQAIENFADLGRYFDMPLRTYSSGMQSRLAFSCAVHVDADLVIIDETLAVGDANFKMKCYDRIAQMKKQGQTFLLVSHNQNLVANFCSRGILLENGKKIFDGDTLSAVEAYKRIRTEALGDSDLKGKSLGDPGEPTGLSNEVRLDKFKLTERKLNGETVGVIHAELFAFRDINHVTINFGIRNHQGIVVCAWDGSKGGLSIPVLREGERLPVELCFKKRLLPGRYFVSAIVHQLVGEVAKPLSLNQNFLSFDIVGDDSMSGIADLDMHVQLPSKSEASVSSPKFSSSFSFSHRPPYDPLFAERIPLLQVFQLALLNYLRRFRMAAAVPSQFDDSCFRGAECGVYNGNSLIACASMALDVAVPFRLHGLDTFSGLPPLSEKDRSLAPPDIRYLREPMFTDTSLDLVRRKLEDAGMADHVELHLGLFSETLPKLPEQTYHFVNIDCDLYEPHLECLEYFYARMVPGGIIFLDDYHSADYPMAKSAVDAFMRDKPERLFHLRFGDDGVNRTKAYIEKY